MNGRRLTSLLCTIALVCGWSAASAAEEYPNRPIEMIIGLAAGATNDVAARMLAKEVEKVLGRDLVPINKPGGGGAVAAAVVAASKPDGYTLLSTVSSTFTAVPHMETVAYKPLDDLIPFFQLGQLVPCLAVRSDSPYKTLREVIEAARKHPGKISIGIPGPGMTPDIVAQLLALKENVDLAIVPFGGSAPVMTALLGGHITVGAVGTPTALPQVKAGALRVVATTGAKRADGLPQVPTLAEQGFGYATTEEMYVFAVPKGTPKAVVEKLEGAFLKAYGNSEYKSKAQAMYTYTDTPLHGQKLAAKIKEQYVLHGSIIKKSDIGK